MQYIYDMPPSGAIRSKQLEDELNAAGIFPQPPHEEIMCATDNISVILDGISEEDSLLAAPVVAAHAPVQFYTQYDRALYNLGQSSAFLMSHLRDVIDQSPIDSSHAILGRAFAFEAGASLEDIQQIVDRASAEAYISQMPEWQALPQSAKDFLTVQLRGIARVLQLLHIVLLSQFPPDV